ncbi:HlyD family type I secretion periplasmic adaptor subunit [Rhizobium mesosinicum]|uniref:Membrane fusion protein (MFP) family protein n=1 Tax=Rhizobium mesosinicum TaxID=335017 RepID=A0ABS7GMW6_9HYPH|nr:HlyD family type I secretion periplasmic adaptor subunit [Rhizobium mesosinicum]MBW9051122.1 HlyD family type I secretion periplasmic adaptor subunit [Rhizobium mesosinicum]
MTSDPTTLLLRSLRRNLVAGTISIAVIFGGMGGWAATTELSGAVIANGILVVDGNVKKVQHPSGGIVSELLVKEGQPVVAGDVIVRLDATVALANLSAISKNLNYLYARQSRLEAERDNLPRVEVPAFLLQRLSGEEARVTMVSENRLFEERKESRDGQRARLREQIAQLREQISGLDVQQEAKGEEIGLVGKELEGLRRLFEVGGITMSQVNALERNAARLRGERGQLIASMAAAHGRIAEIELQLLQVDQSMRAEVAAELRDVENEEAKLIEQEVTASDQLRHIDIRAPVDGVVHELSIHTVGGVITPAETLMTIVPQHDNLTVEARVAPKDIDQLAVGQGARLMLTAFNRNTTPELQGSLVRISADLETDQQTGANFYRASVSIPQTELERLKGLALLPGMPVEIFIRTGDRTVLSYFVKPIRDHANRVFRQD